MPGRFSGATTRFAGRPWSVDLSKSLDKVLGHLRDGMSSVQRPPETPTTVDGTAAADAGDGPAVALDDHQHDADVSGSPGEVALASAQGTGPGFSLSAHTHRFTILTTKGDVLAHDGTNPVRLPVGTNGKVLTAASGATPGVQWSTPAVPLSAIVSKAFADTPYTVPVTVDVVLVDASGGAVTVNLPTAASAVGHVFHIQKTDSGANTVTVDGNGAETIGASGSATQVLSSQGQGISIVAFGGAWWIIGFVV